MKLNVWKHQDEIWRLAPRWKKSDQGGQQRKGKETQGEAKRRGKKKKSKLCLILLRHMIFTICLLSITNICAKNKQERSD